MQSKGRSYAHAKGDNSGWCLCGESMGRRGEGRVMIQVSRELDAREEKEQSAFGTRFILNAGAVEDNGHKESSYIL